MHKIQTLPRLDKVVYDCIINNGIMNWDGTDLLNFLEAVGNKALTEHWNKKIEEYPYDPTKILVHTDKKTYLKDIRFPDPDIEEYEKYDITPEGRLMLKKLNLKINDVHDKVHKPKDSKIGNCQNSGNIVEYTLTRANGYQQTVKYTRKKLYTDEMKNDMRNMLAAGSKRKDICLKYNITLPTLKKYIG